MMVEMIVGTFHTELGGLEDVRSDGIVEVRVLQGGIWWQDVVESSGVEEEHGMHDLTASGRIISILGKIPSRNPNLTRRAFSRLPCHLPTQYTYSTYATTRQRRSRVTIQLHQSIQVKAARWRFSPSAHLSITTNSRVSRLPQALGCP